MSIKTRAQLQAESIAFFPDNDNEEITAERLRNHIINLQDSAVLKVGEVGIQNVLRYLSTVVISDQYDLTTRKYVDDEIAGIDLTTLWNKSGNDLPSRGIFGSTATGTGKGWDYKVNDVVIGAVLDDAKWSFGQATAFSSTYLSVKSPGTDSTTYATQWINTAGSPLTLGWLRDDGLFSAFGGLSTDGVKTIDINTTTSNIKIGESAGNGIAGGSELNVYIGKNSGEGSDGDSNFFGGWLSGYSANVDASVGIGAQSLRLADGTSLLGIGSNAGYGYVGLNSVFIGNGAGTNGTDNYNVYIGDATGENATGNNKVGIDRRALRNSTGNKQFGIGAFAGEDLTDANTGVFGPYYDIYFNGHLENAGYELFQHSVTLQTQMSVAGTNVSSATNVLKLAQSRGTGTGSGGSIVLQYAVLQGSGTDRHTLTDGLVFEANTGYLWSNTSTGEKRLLSGKVVSFSADTTANEKEQTFIYTGTGGHVLTLYSAVGWKGTELSFINNGSGTFDVNGHTVNNGHPVYKLTSDGTNWIP